jgi:hypothetical protein
VLDDPPSPFATCCCARAALLNFAFIVSKSKSVVGTLICSTGC